MKKTHRKKNISKIKLQIIFKFIVSVFLAFLVEMAVALAFFVILEQGWKKQYVLLINWYNGSLEGQMFFVVALLLLFLFNTFFIFLGQMDSITDAISSLSGGIRLLAEGQLDKKIIINQKNELGLLATDVNDMAQRLKESLEKEKQWYQERYNMITNLSHDLKTPMMSIMGYVEMIIQKKYSSDEELLVYCEIVERKTKELNKNINQLFELSKITSADYEIKKQDIYLKEFTEQILLGYIPQLEESNLKFRIDISSDLRIRADVDGLKRLYENLISNTIKYAAEGEYLDIEAKTKPGFASSEIKLIFRNYGKKIEENELAQIFQKFYRQKDSMPKEGSGYGLYIVKRIVELHGFTISVKSDEVCTEFVINMP